MTRAQLTPEEQLDDLQRRFQLLEGERKANYETSRLNISQNKDIIKQMKDENKTLRQQISQLRQEAPPSTAKQLEEKMDELFRVKHKLDAVMHEVERKNRQYETKFDRYSELGLNATAPSAEDDNEMRHIRVLENRMDKAMIKYNEAQSIRKTYEQIVKRLKEEGIGFDTQLGAIEKTLKAKEHDYEELLLLSHDAYHSKEMAQAELHRFEQGVMEERNQRDKEVQEKKLLVQQRVEMNARLELREKRLKTEQNLDREGELALKTSSNLAENAIQSANEGAEEEKQRVQEFEEAFRRIKEATGVVDVNEVIQKFLTQEQTADNLTALTKDSQDRIDTLVKEKKEMKDNVDREKYSYSGSTRPQAGGNLEAQLSEAQGKCDRNRGKYERVAKLLIDVKAGVGHVAAHLTYVKLEDQAAPIEMCDDTVEDVLSQCELKLQKLLQSTNMDHQGNKKIKAQIEEQEAKMLKKCEADFRGRIPDNDNDGDEDDEDDFEDDKDEECVSRSYVKYKSESMVDQMEKKKKKKAKPLPIK